jgi:MYXO-CTERM domain-containing protein
MRTTLALLLAVAACESPTPLGEEAQAILGGTTDSTFPNVCVLHVALPDDGGQPQDPIACTCTLVEERTVLTSARCVNENLEQDMVDGIEVRFGASFDDGNAFEIEAITLHRYFASAGAVNELALIRLATAPTAQPVDIIASAITDDMEGDDLTLVGFGPMVDTSTADGNRNRLTIPISSVAARHVTAGTEDQTTCAADSGAPGFLDLGGPDQVMAVMTARQDTCNTSVPRLRLDIYRDDFLIPFIDLYSGACPLDGTCTTAGCRTPDRDCPDNACLWSNDPAGCEEDCPTRDWDCPLGAFAGQACAKDGDCEEGGRCIAAEDDDSFRYCTRACDAAGNPCPVGLDCVSDECVFTGASEGAICSGNGDCRSGICECGLCVAEAGTGACAQGGGGFCAVGGDDPARSLAPLLLLALAVPFFIRRRRARR